MKRLALESIMSQTANASAAQKESKLRISETNKHLGYPHWHAWKIWGNDSIWIHRNETMLFGVFFVIMVHLIFGVSACLNWPVALNLMIGLSLVGLGAWLALEWFAMVVVFMALKTYRLYRKESY